MNSITPIDAWRGGAPPPQRMLPASIETEQALLGAVLVNAEAFPQASSVVKAAHFSEEIHARIFDVMGQLVLAGRPITPAGLLTYLGDQELAEGITTGRYLARLMAEAITVIGAPEYARIVRDLAVRRSLIEASQRLAEGAYDAKVDATPDDVASGALESLRTILEASPRHRSRFHLGQGMEALVQRIERIRRGEEQRRGLSTGYPDLDRALGGLQPGTIVVAAGRVAMGKTILMTNLATKVARRNEGIGVLEFSLEIPADQLQARHLAEAVFDHRRALTFGAILKGDMDDGDAEQVILAQRAFVGLPIIVECPSKITAAEIVARIHIEKKAMAASGVTLGVVLIDYLDKIAATDRYAGQRTYELQEIITTLKASALAEDVCIVLLAQLNRATEGREDKRPSLADLKSSSFIEQEAHAIIFVYREAYYLQKSADYREGKPEAHAQFDQIQNDVELIIGKNRGGPEVTVRLWGDVACSVFSSRASEGF